MGTLSSIRRPYPFDARLSFTPAPISHNTIGDWRPFTIGQLRPKQIGSLRIQTQGSPIQHGIMLVPNAQNGLMVGKQQHNLADSTPPQADYGSSPTYKEKTFVFRPTGGFGESIQSSGTDRRYHYAMDMWITGGLFGQGPLVHQVSPPTTGRIRLFVEALGSGGTALALYALAGANVLLRNDDSANGMAAIHSRAGRLAMDAVRFRGAYASPADALYVAWNDGLLEEYDGTTWRTCLLPSGFAPQLLCKLGDELWAADPLTDQIRKVSADPKVAGNWGGPIQVGTPTAPITTLRQTTNRLVIGKADGMIFTINGDGTDNDMFPGLLATTDPDNMRTTAAWQGSLWFRIGPAFWRLDMQGGAVLTPVGPERNLTNQSEVRGPVQAFAGWNSKLAFGVLYNALTNTSYLMTFGNWEPTPGTGGAAQFAFTDQWDGAIAHWAGRKATALLVSSVPSEARLYVGFEDGTYAWITLVNFPLVPASGGEFNTGGYIVWPLHHDMLQADIKAVHGVSVFGPVFPTDGVIRVSYRLRGSTGMPVADASGNFLTNVADPLVANGQRSDFVYPIAAHAIELRADFTSSSSTSSVVLEGMGLHERVVPAFRRDYQFTVDARDHVARRDGASTRNSGRWVRDLIAQAAASPARIALEMPDETIRDVAWFDYVEHQVAHSALGGQGWGIDCQVTEFGLRSSYGTIGRTRGTIIGATRGFQISRLKFF